MTHRRVPLPFQRHSCRARKLDRIFIDFVVEQHSIGNRSEICGFCKARKWVNEKPSICCMSGKVDLEIFPEPPRLFQELFLGTSERSVVFRKYVRHLNNSLAMASIKMGNANSTPEPYQPTVFLQVTFFWYYFDLNFFQTESSLGEKLQAYRAFKNR